MLSALSSFEIGLIRTEELTLWIDRVLTTVEKLEKWHGHLYNWYNIKSLAVLQPNYVSTVDSGNFIAHMIAVKQGLLSIAGLPNQSVLLASNLRQLAVRMDNLIKHTDFSVLYDPQRRLFHVGYTVSSSKADPSYYDLLASESRLTSLVAIAKGDVPLKHWFRLGRPLTLVRGVPTLVSWSGTMFE